MAITYEDFLMTVPVAHQVFVAGLHDHLIGLGCKLNLKAAKSGYVVSYQWNKKTIMNWVFRKAGVLARLYGDNAGRYESVIAALPADMQKKMTGASDCKRLHDSAPCSSRCVMGMVYNLNVDIYKKCRYDGMFFLLTAESGPHIKELASSEISARKAAS